MTENFQPLEKNLPANKATSSPFFIRADASAQIGTGHVMRMIALAQAWRREGGTATFLCSQIPDALAARVRGEGFEVVVLGGIAKGAADARATIDAIRNRTEGSVSRTPISDCWLAADGYHSDVEYQRAIKAAGLRLLVMDDNGENREYVSDLVLNQNIHAHESMYANRAQSTRLLLGTRYVLLREEFSSAASATRELAPVAKKVLVTMGGGDPDNVTGKVVEALRDLDVELRVVVGGSNPNLEKLRAMAAQSGSRISLEVDVKDMPQLIRWADIAVTAGGSTCWEFLCLGTPFAVVCIADNQAGIAAELDRRGIAPSLGWFRDLSADAVASVVSEIARDHARRSLMRDQGRKLVDGQGSVRVVTRMKASEIVLRRAGPNDSRMIWEWANDPTVRASAFSPEPIPWESHQQWFAARIASDCAAIFIATNGDGNPFGQIRFDWTADGRAEIDLSICAAARNRKAGAALVRAGVDAMISSTPVASFEALVKEENIASRRSFEKAGFRFADDVTVRGRRAARLVLERNDG